MRDKIIYLVIGVLLASCSREKSVPIAIYPLEINFNGDINHLREQLSKRDASLAYEDSYENIDKGIRLFYLNDDNDSMHYRFDVFVIDGKIKGVDGAIFSKYLSKDTLYHRIEAVILPSFKESTEELKNAFIVAERKMSEDVRGDTYYYHFEIKTKELQEKLR